MLLKTTQSIVDIEGYIKGGYSQQTNDDSYETETYGYLHSEHAIDDPDAAMDYFTEREKMNEKRDKIIGYPLPNNDIFSVTGEALGGTFQAYRTEYGHYRPNTMSSETYTVNAGGDLNVPSILTPVGILNTVTSLGIDLGGGYNETKVREWDNQKLEDDLGQFQFHGDDALTSKERFAFRFASDKVSAMDLTGSDEATKASLDKQFLKSRATITEPVSFDKRIRRSSYIDMNMNKDFSSPIPYEVHTQELHIINEQGSVEKYNRSGYNEDGFGEFTTFNADGVKYTYGLPVHTRNEKQLSYSLKSDDFDVSILNSIGGGLIVEVDNDHLDTEAKRKQGFESSTDYATQHLLTEITSPDYIDRTMNGPTEDDFGTYTKFNYVRATGGNDWFEYRSPYKGMNFSYGSLSDKKDDMGSFNSGEKELYYIHSVVSKTHVAIFTLGDRDDGHSIPASYGLIKNLIAPEKNKDGAVKKVKFIKRIDLYPLTDCQLKMSSVNTIYEPKTGVVPLKTVHFQYDYSLCKGIDNGTNPPDDDDTNDPQDDDIEGGKLTLKKVWFEYGGKLKNRISPYEFTYEYPTVNYPSTYSGLQVNTTSLEENPNYNVLNTDRWGDARLFDKIESKIKDLARFFPFTYQGEISEYDPAAWCLKQIKLPSGGEIHVQYEKNDYAYVQDQKAMIMVPLTSDTEDWEKNAGDKKYYVDLDKVNIDFTSITEDTDKEELVKELFQPMANKQRLFFNFLYRLIESGKVDYQTLNSEYIEGYARIRSYGYDNNGVYFSFKDVDDDDEGIFHKKISYDQALNKNINPNEIPREVCKDFYLNNRQGHISDNSNSLSDSEDKEAVLNTILSVVKQIAGVTNRCVRMKPEMSYVRLQTPMNYSKKGGGVRVKRLLMYDAGMGDNMDPVVYGNEYEYTQYINPSNPSEGVMTSGVASNEPGSGRRESPLVYPLDKEHQTRWNSMLYGRDMYGSEMPLGESLLPGASIGYAKVTVKNIHQGKTSTGREEHEFYTCKDYPFKAQKTSITQQHVTPISIGGGYGGIGGSYKRTSPHMTQGYSFISNDMHGKPKKSKKFAYSEDNTSKEEVNADVVVAQETYYYSGVGESVDVIDENLNVTKKILGKEGEMLSEMREVYDLNVGGNIGADFSLGNFTTYPIPTPIPLPIWLKTGKSLGNFRLSGSYNENILRTHVTTKIINYSTVTLKTESMADGVTHVTKNVYFDKYTGNPLVTKTYDDFGESYTSQNIRAGYAYKNFAPKDNLNFKTDVVLNSDADGYYLDFAASGNCDAMGSLAKGDLYEVIGNVTSLFHADELDAERHRVYLKLSGHSSKENDPSTGNVSIRVLRSGFNNQLNVDIGSIMFHGDGTFSEKKPNEDEINTLVSSLNNALASVKGTINKIAVIPIPDNLRINSGGDCQYGNEFEKDESGTEKNRFAIRTDESGNYFFEKQIPYDEPINWNEEDYVGPGNSQHPLVTDLNEVLRYLYEEVVVSPQEIENKYGGDFTLTGQKFAKILEDRKAVVNNQDITYREDLSINSSYTDPEDPMNYHLTEQEYDQMNEYHNPDHLYGYTIHPNDFEQDKGWKDALQKKLIDRLGDYKCINGAHEGGFSEALKNPDDIINLNRSKILMNYSENDQSEASQKFRLLNWQLSLRPNYGKEGSLPVIYNNDVLDKTPEDIYLNNYGTKIYTSVTFEKDDYSVCKPSDTYTYNGIEYEKGANNCYGAPSDLQVSTKSKGYDVDYKFSGTKSQKRYYKYPLNADPYIATDGYLSISNTFYKNKYYLSTGFCERGLFDGISSNQDVYGDKLNDISIGNCGNLENINTLSYKVYDKEEKNTRNFGNGTSSNRYYIDGTVVDDNNFDNFYDELAMLKTIDSYSYEDIYGKYSIQKENVEYPAGICKKEKEIEYLAYSRPEITYNPTNDALTFTAGSSELLMPLIKFDKVYSEGITCASCSSKLSENATEITSNTKFSYNEETGQLELTEGNNCSSRTFNCLEVCPETSEGLSNVVASSAVVLDDHWTYTAADYPIEDQTFDLNLNEYETGEKGRWRVKESYVYRSPLDGHLADNDQWNYNKGTYEFIPFDWKDQSLNPSSWVKTSTMKEYTPYGQAVEEENILGIKSTAEYGYRNTLMTLVAQNAAYKSVAYESFEEELYNPNLSLSTTQVHTGKKSLELVKGTNYSITSLVSNNQIHSKGLLIRAWIWNNESPDALDKKVNMKIGSSDLFEMKRISSGGEWHLYETIIPANIISSTASPLAISIELSDEYVSTSQVFVDDIRIQPLDAEMVCYVYDENQRLIASFDDQHYALLYQYNAEGALVRKLKETVQGVKMISETQYNTQGKDRFELAKELHY